MPRLVPPGRVPTKRALGRKPAQSWQPGESRLFMELACRNTDLKNLRSQWMGLFCGVGTITTSHILVFVLKAQVGPGSLKQELLKGQGVAQVLAAPKVWLPITCENCPVLWMCRCAGKDGSSSPAPG